MGEDVARSLSGFRCQGTASAVQVAGGYRRPLPSFIPAPLRELITECWAQSQQDRPPITEVVDRLTAFQKGPQLPVSNGAGKDHHAESSAKKRCCTVM